MPDFSFLILYVDNPPASATFYSGLLERPIIEQAPTFAMLPLRDGIMLGLWSRQAVEPPANGAAGAGEIAFVVIDTGEVDRLHADWASRGLTIAQPPTRMDFGYTFTALDPDGHRLRVFRPAAE
ncbi:VOC family protein [Bradyrhizobium sp. HKCCYLS1011]|uniref:VOC family protein n=1 Tax=Bradyrhizobium sp. HKCCYLS1011 TaxID=3420733 RepID=UPI003EBEDB73